MSAVTDSCSEKFRAGLGCSSGTLCELNLTAVCDQVSLHCNRVLLKQHKIVVPAAPAALNVGYADVNLHRNLAC